MLIGTIYIQVSYPVTEWAQKYAGVTKIHQSILF